MRILILGGYGVFGKRLTRLLMDRSDLTLVLAGRSKAKADAFAAGLKATAARLETLALDRNGDLAVVLAAQAPDLVVDATGPYQAYGDAPYRVIEACLARGCDYMDLADAAAFVDGVSRYDGEAKAKGVAILSGVSTCPVLTACAVRRLAPGFDRMDAMSAGIGPSPFSGVGLNVIRALTSYAGRRVTAGEGYALIDTRRVTVAPPGGVPLRHRLFALVDTPDAIVLPRLWPSLKAVWFGAAPVPGPYLRLLIALAWLVRLRLLPSAEFLAPFGHWLMNHLSWGEARGGMFVSVSGEKDGRPVTRIWNLVAEGDDGPFIPAMGVAALVFRRLAGRRAPPGARPASEDVDLDDYEAIFATLNIRTGIGDAAPAGASLYRRLLGEAFDRLAAPIRALHEPGEGVSYAGQGRVRRGNPIAGLIASIVGFPRAEEDAPVRVDFTVRDGVETWRRRFGTQSFSSTQEEGRAGLLTERFGPNAFDLAIVQDEEGARLVLRGWRLLGIALPAWLAPRVRSSEDAEGGRFNFHVDIALPLLGRLIAYDGWLERTP